MILMLTTYRDIAESVKYEGEKMNLPVDIFFAAMNEAVDYGKMRISEGSIDVIMSRGGTADLLKQSLDFPVVQILPSSMTLCRAFYHASKISRNIGFLVYEFKNPPYNIENISEVLNVSITPFLWRDLKTLQEQVDCVEKKGINVIVGAGGIAVDMARQKGINAFPAWEDHQTIIDALNRAKEFIRIKDREEENFLLVKGVVDSSKDATIAIDNNGSIRIINKIAHKILNLPKEIIIKENIFKTAYLPDSIIGLFDDKTPLSGVTSISDRTLAYNRIPLITHGNRNGTILIFQYTEEIQEAEHKIRRQLYSKGLIAKTSLPDIVGSSSTMNEVLHRAELFGSLDVTVLITGESGVGKEMFAQGMHNVNAKRRNKPFLAINCAALPENLLESELFGYEEGAFTGARKGGKIGIFEIAHGGTVFLDEIDGISQQFQSRLLRVIQEREIMRIGADKVIPIDVKILAATKRHIPNLIAEGLFRDDLYYRLNAFSVTIPPLRDRKDDIPKLTRVFLNSYNKLYRKKVQMPPKHIMDRLIQYSWPGNVRQLQNMIERYVVLYQDKCNILFIKEFEQECSRDSNKDSPLHPDGTLTLEIGTLESIENQVIEQLMTKMKYRKGEIANILGISRSSLWKKIKTIRGK